MGGAGRGTRGAGRTWRKYVPSRSMSTPCAPQRARQDAWWGEGFGAALDLRVGRAWPEAATEHCGEHAILRPQCLQRGAEALPAHVETHNLLLLRPLTLLLPRPSSALRVAAATRRAD
eukprot:scaffold11191_cov63-Phaeocystis_antarctica.AAC.1